MEDGGAWYSFDRNINPCKTGGDAWYFYKLKYISNGNLIYIMVAPGISLPKTDFLNQTAIPRVIEKPT
jgi:hypothetical protein